PGRSGPAEHRSVIVCRREHGAIEHVRRTGAAGNVPPRQVLIECRSPGEHRAHVRSVRYVPASYITIECSCIGEHPIHIRHAGYIPTAYVAIEQDCTGEHSAHIRYVGNVPTAYVCVKGCSPYGHILQSRNIRQIRDISSV